MTALEYAQAYAAIGWHVFPLLRGQKRPNGKLAPRGHLDATTDPQRIAAWWAQDPEAGIGVAMQPSRLVAVDVDPRNGGHFDLERIEAQHGKLDADVLAFTGGGGLHLVFTAPSDIGRLPGKLAKGIDLKADGYIAVEPTFAPQADPPHLKPYAWEASSNPLDGCVPSPLPGWIADMSRAGSPVSDGAGAAAPGRQLLEHELADIRAALAMIPAEKRDTWVTVGMALHRDVGGAMAFDLWCAWSQTCPAKFDPQDQARVWRSFTRKPMGQAVQLGTLFDLAYKHGFQRPKAPPRLQVIDGGASASEPSDVPEVVHGPRVSVAAMPVQGLNELARWVFDACTPGHVLVAQAVALSLACAAAGRRYVSVMGDPATAYFGLLTPTGSQARAALAAAERALIRCGLRRVVRSQRMGSAQQVYSAFVRSPSVLYTAADWGEQLGQAKRQPSGLLAIAHGVITGNVYTCDDVALDNWAEIGLKRPESAPKNHVPTIYQPAMTLLAGISEAHLRPIFRRQEIGRGTLDCMLLVPALVADDWSDRITQAPGEVPAAARQQLRLLAGAEPGDEADLQPLDVALVEAPTPIQVVFTCDMASADQRWIQHARGLPAHMRSLSWGARQTMRRIAVAMAAFADPARPIVTESMLAWCETFVRECLQVTLAELEVLGEDDEGKADVGSFVVEFLARRGPEGCSQSDLPKFCKPFRKLSLDDRQQLLGRLLADESVIDFPGRSGKGVRYVARQFVRMPGDTGDLGDRPVSDMEATSHR